MPQKLKLAVSQSRTLSTLKQTLHSLENTTRHAAAQDVDLILFPEAFLGGYPRHCSFGAVVGSRSDEGREQYLQYFKSCPDLGDTPLGGGDDWVDRKLPVAKGAEYRGDGTREFLERVARETGVFVVTGLVEKCGGSLYCGVMYVDPVRGCLGKRRKVMPTGSERLVWAQGSPNTLRAVTTTIKGVKLRMAAAICWENIMPLLRYSLYSQNVNLWLAPTADARPNWWPLMRTVGFEGRCFVLSAISAVKKKHLPAWIDGVAQGSSQQQDTMVNGAASPSPSPAASRYGHERRRSTFTTEDSHEIVLPTMDEDVAAPQDGVAFSPGLSRIRSPAAAHELGHIKSAPAASDVSGEEWACRGGSCIAGPLGQELAQPLWEVEDGGLHVVEADFEDCERGRLDLDVAGSYSRNDAFHLTVDGLDISPPP
jgi:nitrilase